MQSEAHLIADCPALEPEKKKIKQKKDVIQDVKQKGKIVMSESKDDLKSPKKENSEEEGWPKYQKRRPKITYDELTVILVKKAENI